MTNEAILHHFYDVIESVVTVDREDRKSSYIFNCDEVGISLDFRPAKVFCSRSTHSLWSLNSGDKSNYYSYGMRVRRWYNDTLFDYL